MPLSEDDVTERMIESNYVPRRATSSGEASPTDARRSDTSAAVDRADRVASIEAESEPVTSLEEASTAPASVADRASDVGPLDPEPVNAWERSKAEGSPEAVVAPHPGLETVIRRPTVVDLFAGAGGTGWGFHECRFHICAAIERSPHAAKTYAANLGVDVVPSDIGNVAPDALRVQLGLRPYELDVLVGCPPCQGFTRMRNANGASDPRNALVLRYLAFVAEFRPRFAVFENVPGLRRTAHGREFYAALLDGFAALDYAVSEHLVDAADFGVPQHRERAIVIAGRHQEVPPPLVATHGDPTSEDVLAGRRLPWVTVRDAIAELPPLAPGERHPEVPNHVAPRTGLRKTAAAARIREFLERVPVDGGSRLDVPREHWLPCHVEHDGHSDVYGRLAWQRPANTITTGCTNPSKGRFVHPTQHRGLSLREAAALQSFPPNFVFHGDCIAEQIGNAVPPRLALAIASAIHTALGTPPMHGATAEIASFWRARFGDEEQVPAAAREAWQGLADQIVNAVAR